MHRSSGGSPPNPRFLTRPVSWFLLSFGVWSWFVWITFVKNLWKDSSGLAFDDAGDPTGYFWVHLLLAITSFLLGTGIGVLGWQGLRALRGGRAGQDGQPGGAEAGDASGGAVQERERA